MTAPRDGQVGWAVVRPDGSVYVDMDPGRTERDAWVIALGWPTRGEVREAQAAGAYAFRCRLVEVEGEPGPVPV